MFPHLSICTLVVQFQDFTFQLWEVKQRVKTPTNPDFGHLTTLMRWSDVDTTVGRRHDIQLTPDLYGTHTHSNRVLGHPNQHGCGNQSRCQPCGLNDTVRTTSHWGRGTWSCRLCKEYIRSQVEHDHRDDIRITSRGRDHQFRQFIIQDWNTVTECGGLNNCSFRRGDGRPSQTWFPGESLQVTTYFHYRDPIDWGFDPTSNLKPTGQTVYLTLETPRKRWMCNTTHWNPLESFWLTLTEFHRHSVSKPSSTWNFFVSLRIIFSKDIYRSLHPGPHRRTEILSEGVLTIPDRTSTPTTGVTTPYPHLWQCVDYPQTCTQQKGSTRSEKGTCTDWVVQTS